MGSQNSFDEAVSFRESTGTLSFPMTWDPTGESWAFYRVPGQPFGILLDAEGTVLTAWGGAIPEDEVLDLIS